MTTSPMRRLLWGSVVLASALLSFDSERTQAQMAPGLVERAADPRQQPFVLKGSVAPDSPMEGDPVEITGEIGSRVFPHIRTVVRFWIDGEKREETAYVIAPRAESIVVHEWTATRGEHTVRIEVLSPAGVRYTEWERRISVRSR